MPHYHSCITLLSREGCLFFCVLELGVGVGVTESEDEGVGKNRDGCLLWVVLSPGLLSVSKPIHKSNVEYSSICSFVLQIFRVLGSGAKTEEH